MAKLTVIVHEHFYGEAEVRGKNTVLWIRVGQVPTNHEYKLVIVGWQIPVPGFAVIGTERRVVVDKDWYMNQAVKRATIDWGPPEKTLTLTYDPDASQGGTWQANEREEYPVKLIRVRRRSRWERVRGKLGLNRTRSRES